MTAWEHSPPARTAQQWANRLAVELAVVTTYPGDETRAVARETLAEYRTWQREQGTLRLMADVLGDGAVADELRRQS